MVNAFRYLKGKKIDLTTGWGTYSTFTARLLKVPDITFNDSECTTNAALYAMLNLTYQFTDVFVTPSSFRQELGLKHLKVESYKELAYLHPNYYAPDPSVFYLMGISRSHDYIVLRFNAFDCAHDFSVRGLTDADKIALVRELSAYGEVFILSESDVPDQIREHVLNVPNRRIHERTILCIVVHHRDADHGDRSRTSRHTDNPQQRLCRRLRRGRVHRA